MTKLEIIDETVAFYSADPKRRAIAIRKFQENGEEVEKPVCVYDTGDGRNCAVGRCLSKPEVFANDSSTAQDLFYEKGFGILKPEYRIEIGMFWTHLQSLHDTDRYWDENGLTQTGQNKVEQLKSKYAE